MPLGIRRRKPVWVSVALAALTALPLLAVAGPATAAPASSGRARPAAAPANELLDTLGGLLAQLLPGLAPAVPGAPPAVASQVAASTVRVDAIGCGLHLQGSGFSPAPDTIVTNAHVVAGTTKTGVLRPDGRTLPAQVQVFDPVRDLAVLAVPGLDEPSLALGSATVGESDAIYGHPEGRAALSVIPAQVLRRVNVDIGDIYDRPSAPRQILVLDARLEPGHSGSPLVTAGGKVVGVAFAASNVRPSIAFAIASEEVAPVLAQPRSGAVSTGPCIAE